MNVNEALHLGLMFLKDDGTLKPTQTRNGLVLKWPTPVLTSYRYPEERVLINKKRDCNPFFHFFESLWMLAGRQDVKFLKVFVSRIENYSDDKVKFNAAYGYRIRNWTFVDQLEKAIQCLKMDKTTRRVVIQIWQVNDLGKASEDIPCNTQLYLWVEHGPLLNLTICNRSNDMLWGAYGANAVHFSMILEFIACCIGCGVGTMYQFSNNMHVYIDTGPYKKLQEENDHFIDPYVVKGIDPYKMNKGMPDSIQFKSKFLTDVETYFTMFDKFETLRFLNINAYYTDFFKEVVIPMNNCFLNFKAGHNSDDCLEQIQATDWRLACEQYLENRKETAK